MRYLRQFNQAENGNIAILFAFVLPLLLLFTGGAVDFSRRNSVRADLVESLDAAGLAMARLEEAPTPELAALSGSAREDYIKAYGERFFYENFKYENEIEDLELDFIVTPQVIEPTAQGRIKTLFLGAARALGASSHEFLSMDASTQITRRGSGPIELALVLDVTGSMSESIDSVKKIASLRTASDALLDVLYGEDENATSDNVRTAVVPFNAYVNAGGAIDDTDQKVWNSNWSDTNALAAYHGARFLHVTNTGVVDMNTKVNHFNLFNSNTATTWKGCLEERPYPLDEIDVAAGAAADVGEIDDYNQAPPDTTNSLSLNAFSTAPSFSLPVAQLTNIVNSRFVPMFVMDDPNCNDGNNSNDNCGWTQSPTSGTHAGTGIAWSSAWFDDPDDDSNTEANYNNTWINDRSFTRSTGSTAFGRYLPVANYFRRVTRGVNGGSCPTTPTSTVTDTPFYNFLASYNATQCGTDEYALRSAYIGQWNAATLKYEGKLDLSVSLDETVSEASNDEYTRGPNRDCPAPLLVGSDKKKKVRDHIYSLAPNGNTNSAEGMMWGWRVLSPEAPFANDIPYNDNRWQKAVVLMTDGFNTVSSRDTHLGSDQSAYGYAVETRMGVGIDTASKMKTQLDRKLLRICERMKAKGVLIYAITFGLSDTDADELATKQTFQACATETEEPYYFDAPAGEDLEEAFADIAADLVQLHVSQ